MTPIECTDAILSCLSFPPSESERARIGAIIACHTLAVQRETISILSQKAVEIIQNATKEVSNVKDNHVPVSNAGS